jgi:hypothetical protein
MREKLQRFVRNYGEMCGNLFITQGRSDLVLGNPANERVDFEDGWLIEIQLHNLG